MPFGLGFPVSAVLAFFSICFISAYPLVFSNGPCYIVVARSDELRRLPRAVEYVFFAIFIYQHDFPVDRFLVDGFYVSDCSVSKSSKIIVKGMQRVFGLRTPLKVLNSVVVFEPIFVVYARIVIRVINKMFCNQSMK